MGVCVAGLWGVPVGGEGLDVGAETAAERQRESAAQAAETSCRHRQPGGTGVGVCDTQSKYTGFDPSSWSKKSNLASSS